MLRNAEKQDSIAIRTLVRSANLNPFGLNWRRFVVAVNLSRHVIGCVQLKPHRDGSLELASLVVKEEWRGSGIARALIEKIVENHDGCLYLMCRTDLGSFYEQFGFNQAANQALPPFFRRVSKLADRLQQITKKKEGVLIMCRDCGELGLT
ncbi:MAG: GNAT family N-acetyltransferase [Anaerolineales bacterium]|nr:GNAT family N-acetyltransferase [Anaerolineales bacterium]